jgi:hypothetical protein
MELFFKRHFHLNVTARCCCIHRCHDVFSDKLDHRPLRMFEHYEGDFSRLQILLVTDVLVGRNDEFKTGLFGGFDQCAVFLVLPSHGACLPDTMTLEESRDAARCSVVEKYFHP